MSRAEEMKLSPPAALFAGGLKGDGVFMLLHRFWVFYFHEYKQVTVSTAAASSQLALIIMSVHAWTEIQC